MRVFLSLGLFIGLFSAVRSPGTSTGRKRPSPEPIGGSVAPRSSKRPKPIQPQETETKHCGHLAFTMIKSVDNLPPGREVDYSLACLNEVLKFSRYLGKGPDGQLFDTQQQFDSQLSAAHQGSHIKWIDVCQASGSVCYRYMSHMQVSFPEPEVSAAPRQTHASTSNTPLASGTCRAWTARTGQGCDWRTRSCLCRIKLQMQNAYTGENVYVPGYPDRRISHDCRVAQICQRLNLVFLGWTCEESLILFTKKCPKIGSSRRPGYAYGKSTEEAETSCRCPIGHDAQQPCVEMKTETIATVSQPGITVKQEPLKQEPEEWIHETTPLQAQSAHTAGVSSPSVFTDLGNLVDNTISQDAWLNAGAAALRTEANLDQYVRYQFADQTLSIRNGIGGQSDQMTQGPVAEADPFQPIQPLAGAGNQASQDLVGELNQDLVQIWQDVGEQDQEMSGDQMISQEDASNLYSWMFL